jgi:propanol-preferring alcohol dehydrogenase
LAGALSTIYHQRMRAMVLEQPRPAAERPLVERDLPLPSPGAGEIRVRVRACGVCHTDLHMVEGDLRLPKLPVVPGHQIAGIVEACGPEARRFREGERVGVPWLHRTCGACPFCASGRENLCESARFTGLDADGGYAEATVVPEGFAHALPGSFTDIAAAPLLCAGVIGYRALRLSEIQPGGRLGLYGFGASAHIVIQIARHRGCEVDVFTRSAEHRELARRLGAAWTGRAEETPGAPLDAAIIFAPAGQLVPEALRVLRKGGVVALAGITMSPIPQLDYARLYHERTLRSVANSTRRDVTELLELAAAIPLRTEVETFRLEQANEALVALKESRIRGAGVLIV